MEHRRAARQKYQVSLRKQVCLCSCADPECHLIVGVSSRLVVVCFFFQLMAVQAPASIRLENPLTADRPFGISDPDGLLTSSAIHTVEAILARSPVRVGVAIFKALGCKRTRVDPAVWPISRVARFLFDQWLGPGSDGVVYALAFLDREHQLWVGPSRSRGRLGESARKSVLEAAVPALRRRDLDAAVVAVARQLVFEVRMGWLLRRVMVAPILCTAFFLSAATLRNLLVGSWHWGQKDTAFETATQM